MSSIRTACAILLAVLVAAGAVYWKGQHDARLAAEVANARTTERQINERAKTDARINRMDARGVCRELGGVWIDGKCQ